MRGESSCVHRDLPLTLALSQGRGKAPPSIKSRKLILPPYPPAHNALGFRDGRHELSHLCPEASGACPRLGCDTPKLRQGVRPGRGALNDRPHLPVVLETGWRQPGKTPRTGCRRCHVIQINPMSALAGIPFPPILRRIGVRRRRSVPWSQPLRTHTGVIPRSRPRRDPGDLRFPAERVDEVPRTSRGMTVVKCWRD